MLKIMLMSVLVFANSCILDLSDILSDDDERRKNLLGYKDLKLLYHLAFEKRNLRDEDLLPNLERETTKSLESSKIEKEHIVEIRKLRYKLRSYMSFRRIAKKIIVIEENDKDDNNEKKEPPVGFESRFMDKLLSASIEHVDPDLNEDFYENLSDKAIDIRSNVWGVQKQKFFRELVATTLAITEQAMGKVASLFPFEKIAMNSFCPKNNFSECKQITNNKKKVGERQYRNVEEVTAMLNRLIRALNKVINELDKHDAVVRNFIYYTLDEKNENVKYLYQKYEYLLLKAAHLGLLPLMFTEIFRQRSGNMYFSPTGIIKVKYFLLTEVTPLTVERAIVEVKQKVVGRWVELRETREKNFFAKDRDVYRWMIINEIATTRLVLRDAANSYVVSHLLQKFQHEKRDPNTMRILRNSLSVVGYGSFLQVGIFALGFMISLPIWASLLAHTAIVAATAVNFGWIGIASFSSVVAQNRYLELEQAVMSGTSEWGAGGLEALREFNEVRKQAILAGTIGLAFTFPAVKYAISHMGDGGKATALDWLAMAFVEAEEFAHEEDMTDADLLKIGH